MIHRQSGKPLTVKIAPNKLKKEINESNAKYNSLEDKIMDLGDKHELDQEYNIWEMIFRWQPIVAGIGLILLILIILMMMRRTFFMWSRHHSQTHYGSERYGPADIEEVKMFPLKHHPALKTDRIEPITGIEGRARVSVI